jgi:hypothetical protein
MVGFSCDDYSDAARSGIHRIFFQNASLVQGTIISTAFKTASVYASAATK